MIIAEMTKVDSLCREKRTYQYSTMCRCIDTTQRLHEKRKRRLITGTRNKADNASINRIDLTRTQKWEEEQFYGHF